MRRMRRVDHVVRERRGGAKGTRTPDLFHAMEAL